MSSPCPNCGSWSVRHDRSLAGRAVCGACGATLGGRRGQRSRRRPRPKAHGFRRFWLLLFVGLPIALACAYAQGWLQLPGPLQPQVQPVRTSRVPAMAFGGSACNRNSSTSPSKSWRCA